MRWVLQTDHTARGGKQNEIQRLENAVDSQSERPIRLMCGLSNCAENTRLTDSLDLAILLSIGKCNKLFIASLIVDTSENKNLQKK